MNINKQYAWQPAEGSRENNPLLPVGKLQRYSIICFNPVGWTTITCMCLGRVLIIKNRRFLEKVSMLV